MTKSGKLLAGTVVDCGRFSDERGSAECEERGTVAVGVFAVAAILVLVVGYVLWRIWRGRVSRRLESDQDGTPPSTHSE